MRSRCRAGTLLLVLLFGCSIKPTEPVRGTPMRGVQEGPNPGAPEEKPFVEADIAAIHAPVALVNGEADFVAHMGTRLIDALGVEQVLLPGVGHFDLTAQAEFRDIAIEFLAADRPANRDGKET